MNEVYAAEGSDSERVAYALLLPVREDAGPNDRREIDQHEEHDRDTGDTPSRRGKLPVREEQHGRDEADEERAEDQ